MSNASLELGGGKWAAKEGNLLGYASSTSSSKYVPREFSFTRAADIAATRINSSGLIEKYRENLLLQSNQFDTTWTLNSTSVTSGQSGYDGSSDAWLLNSTTTGFPRIEQLVSASGVSTFSVYAKPATDGFALIRTFGAEATAWFDLINGTITNASGAQYVSSKIQFVGNGWYRCSVTFNGSLTTARIYPASAYGTYSTSGNGVYIQDTQIEKGLVATSYLESGATTATSGVADNEPRIDYTGGTASLLLEPQRTNLIPHSEYLPSFNSLLTFNSITSPEGLVNAVKIVEDTNTNMHGIRKTDIFPTNASAVFYTISVFAKKNQRDFLQIQTYADTTSINSNGFDLTNGTITGDSTNHKIEDYGNGWYRCSFTVSITQSTGSFNFIRIAMGKVNSSFYYTGDNTSGLYLYGLQLEEGSYPTSYIPTYGTSDTRAEDTTNEKNFSSPYGDSNTWFFELKRIVDTSLSNQSIAIIKNDSTGASNRFTIFSTSNGRFRVLLSDENGTTENLYSTNNSFDKGETIKAAVKITPSGCTLFVDGSSVATSSSVGTITGIDAITYFRKAALKQFSIFPTALSDAECITLTT